MKTLLAYLQLMRFPLVFTAAGDILVGFLLTHGTLDPMPTFLLLLAASVCLYLSGMVLNDVFDVEQDTAERPHRPIPSGAVSMLAARILGFGLMAAGIGLSVGAGMNSAIIAGLLAACILMYDRWAKRNRSGPFFMGLCRTLNILLGASAVVVVEDWSAAYQHSQGFKLALIVAGLMGFYIAGVTQFAKSEAGDNRRPQLLTGACYVFASLMGMMVVYFQYAGPVSMAIVGLAAMAINVRVRVALKTPEPKTVMPAVGLMLQWYLFLDAAAIFSVATVPKLYAVATAALILPIILLKKVIPLT